MEPFSANIDPTESYIHILFLSLWTLAVSFSSFIAVISKSSTIVDGDIRIRDNRKNHRPSIGCFQVVFLLGCLYAPISIIVKRLQNSALYSLASDETNQLAFFIVKEAARKTNYIVDVGLSQLLLKPDKDTASINELWVYLTSLITAFSFLGLIMPVKFSSPKKIFLIMTTSVVLWALASILALFSLSGISLLENTWLDGKYRYGGVDERRFLGNWFGTDGKNIVQLSEVEQFRKPFCETFRNAITQDNNPITQNIEDSRTLSNHSWTISEKALSELLVVYGAGKPVGPNEYRAFAYFAPVFFMTGPVTASHMLRSSLLWPFYGVYIVILFLLIVWGTPALLLPLLAPEDASGNIFFCRRHFHVAIMDKITKRIIQIDLSMFILTFLIVVLHSQRWYKESQKRLFDDIAKFKTGSSEIVYDSTGNLNW